MNEIIVNKALIILGKFPRKGNVKTRLAKDIGDKKAVLFYKKCAEGIFKKVKLLENTKIYFYYSDINDKENVNKWIKETFECVDPKSSDIEQNLLFAFENSFSSGAKKVVSIATDVPSISEELINQAFDKLNKFDVVIGPDNDGGFYLFGIKKFYPGLFTYKYQDRLNMVKEEIGRIKSFGLSVYVLPSLIDVDSLYDLELLSKS